jgi:hypothetical protein
MIIGRYLLTFLFQYCRDECSQLSGIWEAAAVIFSNSSQMWRRTSFQRQARSIQRLSIAHFEQILAIAHSFLLRYKHFGLTKFWLNQARIRRSGAKDSSVSEVSSIYFDCRLNTWPLGLSWTHQWTLSHNWWRFVFVRRCHGKGHCLNLFSLCWKFSNSNFFIRGGEGHGEGVWSMLISFSSEFNQVGCELIALQSSYRSLCNFTHLRLGGQTCRWNWQEDHSSGGEIRF